jgi:lysozyme
MTPTKPQSKKAAWIGLCIAGGCGFAGLSTLEGVRPVAYRDPVGIPTVCMGETKGVRLGDTYTRAECIEMAGTRVEEFGRGVDACVTKPLPDTRKAALVSFAYNIGVHGFCKSLVVRKINAGDIVGGCRALLQYTKAKGVELAGLVKRRWAEYQLCLKD